MAQLQQMLPAIVERNSPKRKKRRLEESSRRMLSFEEFDGLPVLARSAPEWNRLLAENPQFWREKCLEWHQKLEQAFKLKDVISLLLTISVFNS